MNKLIFVVPLFLLVLTMPVQAYQSLDVNVTKSTSSYLQCVNQTSDNQIYCYSMFNGWVGGLSKTYLYKTNATGGNTQQCQFEASTSGNSNHKFAIIDDNTAYYNWGNSYCELWNISQISSGTCTFINQTSSCPQTVFVHPHLANPGGVQLDVAEGKIYLPTGTSDWGIYNPSNWSSFENPFWAFLYDWGFGEKPAYAVTTPIDSDNTDIYIYNPGSTSQKYTHSPFYQYENGGLINIIDSPVDYFGICLANNTCWSSIIQTGNPNVTWIFINDYTSGRFYRGNFTSLENYSTSCDTDSFPGTPIGTTCVQGSSTWYVTNFDNCTYDVEACPTNSFCVQTSPTINASTDIIENFTDCRINTYFGTKVPCITVCYPDNTLLWSNCYESNCRQCGNATYGIFTNRYYSDAPISVNNWAITCVDKTTGAEVYTVNSTGNQTTTLGLLEQSGANITVTAPDGTCTNTTSVCYDASCNTVSCQGAVISDNIFTNPASAIGLMIGGLFGLTGLAALNVASLALTMLMAVGLLILLAKFVKVHGKDAAMVIMIMSAMLLVMFTILQWLNPMIMIVLVLLDAFVLAKMLQLT